MSEVSAVAKAVEETAKLGQQIVQTGDKACSFVASILKDPLQELSGMATDSIKLRRLRRLDAMADEVRSILDRNSVTETRQVSEKVALPLLEAASVEDEPELQKLWNELLASAMNPSYTEEIPVAYVDVLKGMSPRDAKLLARLYGLAADCGDNSIERCSETGFRKGPLCRDQEISPEEYELSVMNLRRLQCVGSYMLKAKAGPGIKIGSGDHLTIDQGNDTIALTPLGIKIIEACGGALPVKTSGRVRNPWVESYDFNAVIDVSQQVYPARFS